MVEKNNRNDFLGYLQQFGNNLTKDITPPLEEDDFLLDPLDILRDTGLLEQVSNIVNNGNSQIKTSPAQVERLVRETTRKYFQDKKNNGELLFWLKRKYEGVANTFSARPADEKASKWIEERYRILSGVSSWQELLLESSKGGVEIAGKSAKYVIPATLIITGATLMVADPTQAGKVVGPALIELGFVSSKAFKNGFDKGTLNQIVGSLKTIINTPPPEGI
jgi:hypothetical protein